VPSRTDRLTPAPMSNVITANAVRKVRVMGAGAGNASHGRGCKQMAQADSRQIATQHENTLTNVDTLLQFVTVIVCAVDFRPHRPPRRQRDHTSRR
jgi:hypothetical protein